MPPKPKDTKQLNMNLSSDLWEQIDRYRFQQMFPSRTEAIEFLLRHALKQKPRRETSAERA